MLERLTCSQGHQWQTTIDDAGAAPTLCPICGEHPQETVVIEPSAADAPQSSVAADVTADLTTPPAPAVEATADLTTPPAPAVEATADLTEPPAQAVEATADLTDVPAKPMDATADLTPHAAPAYADATIDSLPAAADVTGKPPESLWAKGRQTRDESRNNTVGGADSSGAKASKEVPGFEILKELGRGGMGVVYKARQLGLNRIVALKMILHGGHASQLELARFRLEAEAIAQLQHPNIVQVYEVGEHDDCPFFTLEFVEGDNLAGKINGTPQGPREAAQIILQIADAMTAAHRHGIIHRDLKPANILLTESGVPKVTDFGLAKRFDDKDDGVTRSGAVIGTPSYMAPEQAAGKTKHAGPAADIYSIGAILYDLLTGRPPFQGQTLMDTLHQVKNAEPVPPVRLQSKVPRDLDVICLKALEKEPQRRYASAADLADDLRRFLNGEPIRARPTPWWERTIKWARRNPAAAAIVALSTLFVVTALTFGGLWLNAARESAEQREQQQAQLARVEKQRADEQGRLRLLAETARKEADKQRQRAEENFKYARGAVDEMLTRVGQEKLAHEPRMEKIRRQLLEKALEFYDRFLLVKSNDPGLRWEAGRAQQRAADIQVMLGQYSDAEKSYRKAEGFFTKLADEFPTLPEYRQDLAADLNNLGNLFHETGRHADAEKVYRQALDLRKKLVTEQTLLAYRKDLASSFNNLALVLQKLGRLRDAEPAFAEGQKILQQLTKELPEDASYRQELARAHSNMGVLLTALNNAVAAEENLTESTKILEELALQYKEVPDYRQELALSHNHLGDLWRDSEPEKAEASYQRGLKLRQQLANDFPSVPGYRHDLAASYSTLAVLLQATGRQPEADKAYAQALELRQKISDDFPAVPEFRRNLATGYTNRGILLHTYNRLQEAETAYRAAEKLFAGLASKYPDVPDYEQELAGIYLNLATLLANLGQPPEAEKVCRKALDIQTKLAAKFPQVSYRHELARLHMNLGSLVRMNNDVQGAEKAFRSAVEVFGKLAEEFPSVADYRHQLAVSWNNLGNTLRDLKRPDEAEPAWRKSLSILDELQKDFPQTPIYRQELGRSHNELGIFLATAGRPKEADTAWRDAVTLQEKLVAESSAKPDYRQELSRSYSNYGILLSQAAQNDEAVRVYRRAVTLLEELEPKLPVTPSYTRDLMTCHVNLASLLQAIKRPQEAENSQLRVLALQEKLAEAFPNVPAYRAEFGLNLHEIARRYLEGDKHAEARPLLTKAIGQLRESIAQSPSEMPLRQLLFGVQLTQMEMLASLGDHQEAARLAGAAKMIIEDAKSVAGDMPRWEYHRVAAILGRCATAAERDAKTPEKDRKTAVKNYGDQTLDWLKKAVDGGFRDASFLKSADFDAVRERVEFQKLTVDLASNESSWLTDVPRGDYRKRTTCGQDLAHAARDFTEGAEIRHAARYRLAMEHFDDPLEESEEYM